MQNLKELLIALVAIAVAGAKAKANDGKFSFGDLPIFLPAMQKVPAAVKDVGAIRNEWESRTDAEIDAMIDEVQAEVSDLPSNDTTKAWIKRGLEESLQFADWVADGFDLFDDPQASDGGPG